MLNWILIGVGIIALVWICWAQRTRPEPQREVWELYDEGAGQWYEEGTTPPSEQPIIVVDENPLDTARVAFDCLRAGIAAFAREQAESSAGLDTGATRLMLTDLEIELADLDNGWTPIDVDIAVAQAQAQLAVLYQDLDKLDKDFSVVGERSLNELRGASAKSIRSMLMLERKLKTLTKALAAAEVADDAAVEEELDV